MTPTRIIIEGCDGTGKTTLVKMLAARYGFDVCHCTGDDPKDFEFYKQTARKMKTIWDRHTIGELIYPTVFNRKGQISTEDARIILSYAQENDGKVLVLTAADDVIKKRLTDRGDEDERIIKNIHYINSQFVYYADVFNIPIIDTSEAKISEIFDLLETPYDFKFIHK